VTATSTAPVTAGTRSTSRGILPPRYQDPNTRVSAAPMGAAALQYDDKGEVAWDEMWKGYCELALAGGDRPARLRGHARAEGHDDGGRQRLSGQSGSPGSTRWLRTRRGA